MNAKSLHPAGRGAAVARIHNRDTGPYVTPAGTVGHACCCAARPAVRVIMPPSQSRPHPVELLLCGHHYRVSRRVLAYAGAVIRPLPGTPADIASWIGIEPDASAVGLS
jgi:hypothetical protein